MKHLLLSLSLLAISAQVNGSNFYAGLSIGSANTGGPEILYESYFPGQRIEGNSGVISIYTGYNINKNISFELGYFNLEKMRTSIKVDHSVNTLEPANNIFSINSEKVFLNTKLQHHINNKISAFGIVGYSFYDITYKATGSWTPTSESKSKEEFTFGLGGQYQFNDKFSGRLQWTRDTPGDLEINAYQASVEMNF